VEGEGWSGGAEKGGSRGQQGRAPSRDTGRCNPLGHSALFVTASQMLLDLSGQESARGLDRRLRHYCSRTALLVLDEVGYLSYDARDADLLFQGVSRRYEQRSLVLTTNLPFSEWPTIFPNAACATALIDRVVHHADIITIEGQSYRCRAAEHDATARKNKTRAA